MENVVLVSAEALLAQAFFFSLRNNGYGGPCQCFSASGHSRVLYESWQDLLSFAIRGVRSAHT